MRMAQNCNREYWQQLINKYSERTGELQQKQQELFIRTETLKTLIDSNCNPEKLLLSTPPLPSPPPPPLPSPPTTHDDDISSVHTKTNLSVLEGNQCKCPSEQEQPIGLFQCLLRAIFPSRNPKKLTAETKVEEAQMSASELGPCQCVSPSPIRERDSSECSCVPPMEKLSDSSDCICSIQSNSSTNNKSKASNSSCNNRSKASNSSCNNKSKASSNSTVEPVQDCNKNNYDLHSLKSEDLQLIQTLESLLVEQKTLNNQINELEQKERVYKEFLKEQPINYENKQQLLGCKCLDKNTMNDNSGNNKQELCELKLENLLLKNELKDLKLEIRQYLERIEGPMQFKIESERYKCVKLEEQLEQQRKEFYEQQQLCKNEMNTLNRQLMDANTNLYELKKANEELLLSKQQLELKAKQLEDDLIRQKLSDFETIKSLTEALEKSNKSAEQKESCNLNEIANELSRTLKEIGPCGECSRLPSDIKVTAEYIKELALLLDNKLPPPLGDRLPEKYNAKAPSSERLQEETPSPTLQEEGVAETPLTEESDNLQENVETTSDDIVVVMPESDIKSQSSKSINVDRNVLKLPSPPTQSPIIVTEQSTSKKTCQCSRKRQPITTTDQPPTTKEVEKSTSKKKKCKCSRREPTTTTDEPPTIKEDSVKEESIKGESVEEESVKEESVKEESVKEESVVAESVEAESVKEESVVAESVEAESVKEESVVAESVEAESVKEESVKEESAKEESAKEESVKEESAKEESVKEESITQEEVVDDTQTTRTTTSPTQSIDESKEEQHEPPTTLPKPCNCNVMKQLNQLNNVTGEVEEIVPPSTQTISSTSSSASEKNENTVDNFPLNMDRQVELLDEPPNNNVHVITVITRSGMLDVVTKGPEGHVQTTLRYNPSGNIEVITEILSNDMNTYQRSSPQIRSLQSNENADDLLQQEMLEIEAPVAEIEQGEEGDEDEKE